MVARAILTAPGDTAARIVGQAHADQIEQLSLELYETANTYAAERGIIIADTKFEFGLDESTTPAAVVLIDEVLTPVRTFRSGSSCLGLKPESQELNGPHTPQTCFPTQILGSKKQC